MEAQVFMGGVLGVNFELTPMNKPKHPDDPKLITRALTKALSKVPGLTALCCRKCGNSIYLLSKGARISLADRICKCGGLRTTPR